MRAPAFLAPSVLFAAMLAGCGDSSDSERRPETPASSPAAAPTPEPKVKGEREVISPEDEKLQRAQVLTPKQTPLAVGSSAPAFEGLPIKSLAVIVFFRGEW